MRNGMIGLCLMLSLTAVGCKSSVEASCDKAKECGTLGSQSYDDCVKEGETSYDKLKNDSDCDNIRAKADDLADCSNDLTCDQMKSGDALDKCKTEFEAYVEAVKADGAKCDGTNASGN
jgi:hypothetical protein